MNEKNEKNSENTPVELRVNEAPNEENTTQSKSYFHRSTNCTSCKNQNLNLNKTT